MIFIMLLASGTTCAHAAPGQPPPARVLKLGIIAQDGGGIPAQDVEALLTATLSNSPLFALVERQAIHKVLEEQKLQSLTDSAGAVKIGQLVGADLLLFVEPLKAGKSPAIRLRAVETANGIILMDDLQEIASLTAKPEPLRLQIEAAARKAALPADQRKLVGIVGVSSEEPGTSLDGLASAMAVLLRVDLATSPGVIVLEREQLQHLTTERGLSSMDVQLRASTQLIEVKIKRSQDPQSKDKLDAALTITQMNRGKAQTTDLSLPAADVPAARRQLAATGLKALQAPLPSQAAGDVKAEAAAFHSRASILLTHGYLKEALPLAETAYALDPQIPYARLLMQCYRYVFLNSTPTASSFTVLDSRLGEITLDQLKAEKRILEIHLDMSSRLMASLPPNLPDPKTLPWWPDNIVSAPDGKPADIWWPGAIDFEIDLSGMSLNSPGLSIQNPAVVGAQPGVARVFPLPDSPRTPQQKIVRQMVDLASEEYRLWFDVCRQRQWPVSRLNFIPYGPSGSAYVNASPFLVKDGAEYCRRVQDACEHFEREEAAGRWKNDQRYRAFPDLSPSLETLAVAGRLGNVAHDDIRPLLTWLTEQHDPLLRLQGWAALAHWPGEEGDSAAAKALDVVFRQPLPAWVDKEWLSGHVQSAGTRLRNCGALSRYAKALLDDVEKSGDIVPLARWSLVTRDLLGDLPPQEGIQTAQRLQTLLTGKSVPREDAEGLRHLRRCLAETIDRNQKDLGLVSETNPWDNWQAREIKIANPPAGAPVLIWVQVDPSHKDPELLTLWRSEPIRQTDHHADFTLVLARLPLTGGDLTEIARSTLPSPIYFSERGKVVGFRITSLLPTPQGIFIADFLRGILVARNGKFAAWTQKDGLASDQIWSLGWANNTLYAGADDGLLSIDPKTGRCRTLASGKSAASANPFDGGTPYRIANILPSPDGKSLWLAVGGDQTRLGVWRYDLATAKFDHTLHTSRPSFEQRGLGPFLAWHNGKLLLLNGAGDTYADGLLDPDSGAFLETFKGNGDMITMVQQDILCDERPAKGMGFVFYTSQYGIVLTPTGFANENQSFFPFRDGQVTQDFYLRRSHIATSALVRHWQSVQEAGPGFVAAIYDTPQFLQTRKDFALWYFTSADQPKTAPAPVASQPPSAPVPIR